MRRKELTVSIIIFSITCTIFLISRVHQFADSHYSMLLSECLLYHRSFALDTYAVPQLEPKNHGSYISNGSIYQLESVNGHTYYFFPPGSSILSLPYVALMNAFGIAAVNPDGTYNFQGEAKIEATLAALLMSALVVILFFTSRLLLPFRWSILIAMGSGLGTQIFSTASRALWSDTWGILLLGLVVWMLLAHEVGHYRINPVLLATLLSWTYFVRPTYCLPIAAISIYLFLFYRPMFWRYAVTGSLWFACFVAYSWYHFARMLPSYYLSNRLTFDSFWMALGANLISPSRGLLVFVPAVIFVFYLLIRYGKQLSSPRLVAVCLIIITAHLVIVSSFSQWWGGHSFGPRFTTGLVPWFTLLCILGIRARLSWIERNMASRQRFVRDLELAAGAAFLICSVVINTLGATAHRTWLWNIRPVDIDEQPERVWDWRDPQFLAK